MKRIDILCASQASTAICMSMDHPSSSSASSSSSFLLGGKAIDRHNPIIRDHKRTPRTLPIGPCTSQPPPISPKPYHLLHKGKKSSAKHRAHESRNKSSAKPNEEKTKKSHSGPILEGRKSASTVTKEVSRKSWAKAGEFITPPGSSRYLLGDHRAFFDGLSDYDPVLALVPVESTKTQTLNQDESNSSRTCSSSQPEKEKRPNQVVVLRVSLHCKGCEGKVRKHLSRMEGVTSFNIDFAAKKVTIVGDVTPLGVLASVSKVKNAQFWTPPTIAASNTAAKK